MKQLLEYLWLKSDKGNKELVVQVFAASENGA